METIEDIINQMRYGAIPKHGHDHELLGLFADRIEKALECTSTSEKYSRVGNVAKMYEALDIIRRDSWELMERSNDLRCNILARRISATIRNAISTPPRNCDVGTAEEQWRRWRIFCDSTSCNSCPCQSEYEPSAVCFCRWAQMPYESEVDNAEK